MIHFLRTSSADLQKQHLLQAEAKYYCVDELVLGTEQSLGKLGVEVGRDQMEFFRTLEHKGLGCGADMPGALDHQPEGGAGLDHRQQHEACCQAAYQQVM